MKAKSWGQLKRHDLKCLLAALAACLALVFALVALLNYMVDPYGAFGDRVLQWWSYDETMNPRTAKIRYLEQHHDEYDSYIIGSSGSAHTLLTHSTNTSGPDFTTVFLAIRICAPTKNSAAI